MKKLSWVLLTLLLSGDAVWAGNSASFVRRLNDQATFSGCGCYLALASAKQDEKETYVWQDTYPITFFNIDGKNVQLKAVKDTKGTSDHRKGSKYYEIYKWQDVTLRIDYTVTSTCEGKDEGCEFTGTDAVLNATRGKEEQKVALKGGCGC